MLGGVERPVKQQGFIASLGARPYNRPAFKGSPFKRTRSTTLVGGLNREICYEST